VNISFTKRQGGVAVVNLPELMIKGQSRDLTALVPTNDRRLTLGLEFEADFEADVQTAKK
jgi:hypothetical protein